MSLTTLNISEKMVADEFMQPDRGRATHSKYFRATLRSRRKSYFHCQIDLGFLGQHNKKYGMFLLGNAKPGAGDLPWAGRTVRLWATPGTAAGGQTS